MTNYLQMTNKDLDIKNIIDKVLNKEITWVKAWKLLWISDRQVRRKKQKYKLEWAEWLIHKLRWKRSNHKHNPTNYEQIIKLRKEIYHDYNITHFQEKLEEKHDIKISYWTLRNELINNWLFKNKKQKMRKQFEKRQRRANYWEMDQYDWSYHKWLENRNWWEELCLLLKVDDATGEASGKFDKSEWIVPTFNFWKEDIKINWKPREIYLDKFATYKINHKNATDDKELKTQFWRAMQTFGIKVIFANSAQWKGRVEKANFTFQDRLVKEMREANICDIDSANKFLKEDFLPKYNAKFNVEPREKANLHIPLSKDELEHLDQIFSKHSIRKLKNDFSIAFDNKNYQLYRHKDWWWPTLYKWDMITVEEHLDWNIYFAKNWKYLTSKLLPEKRKRRYKLPMAPANNLHFDEMKKEIVKLEKIDKIKKENKKTVTNTRKKSNWMKNFKIWKAKYNSNKVEDLSIVK